MDVKKKQKQKKNKKKRKRTEGGGRLESTRDKRKGRDSGDNITKQKNTTQLRVFFSLF